MTATAAPVPVTVTGRARWDGFTRYWLSNGWFIDGARRSYHYHAGWKYSLWEPGGDPSGCAGFRGGAPTLALALAVANGGQPCRLASWGCRKLAIGHTTVTVRGHEGRVYHCEDHAPDPPPPPARLTTGRMLVAVPGPGGRRALEAGPR